jgi:uncharacterized membrane protein
MELTGLGGGIMLAIAALLWLIYLLPNWLKNREYLATEKNAVRLQQTIRVLAETTDVPRIVRADAAARRAANGPVAVGRAPSPAPRATVAPSARPGLAAKRLRRTRAGASLVLLASMATALVQSVLMVTVGVVIGSWLVLGAAALAAVLAVTLLRRLAQVARARNVPVERAVRRTSLGHETVAVPQSNPSWTPVPVPKPLYLARTTLAAESHADVNAELARAAAQAEQVLRDRERPPAIEPPAARSVASRFSSMGIVDVSAAGAPDLDAVLARRRAAG